MRAAPKTISIVMLAASLGAAHAQQKQQTTGLNLGNHDSNAPINVTSDTFTGDFQTKVGTYLGNVIIVQGDMKMRADKVNVHVVQGKPSIIDAAGNVLLTAPNGTATGDAGVYDLGPRTITLTGRVVLSKEKNVMRGTNLVVNMQTGEAHLTAKGMPGGRVQGLFIPPPKTPSQSQTNSKTPGK